MSQFYQHPQNFKLDLWDPLNYEYDLINQESIEHIKIYSPYILYWKINQTETKFQNDDLSNLYQETDQIVYSNVSFPIRIYAFIEYSPIINELNRLGLSQIKEINFITNITDFNTKIGRGPLPGDIFRLSDIKMDGSKENLFYTMVSSSTIDYHNFRYVHYLLNAEQTNMYNIPSEIRNFTEIE